MSMGDLSIFWVLLQFFSSETWSSYHTDLSLAWLESHQVILYNLWYCERCSFPAFFLGTFILWALVKFLLWMWNMYHRHSELIVHLGRFNLWWVSCLVFITVSWEVLPLLDKFRGEWLPSTIRLSISSPMEELERGPKKLKWFAPPIGGITIWTVLPDFPGTKPWTKEYTWREQWLQPHMK